MELKKLFIFSSITALSGCMIAPGMQMQAPKSMPAKRDDAVKPTYIPISKSILQELANQKQEEYTVGTQDVLSIAIWNHPEFSISSTAFVNTLKDEANALPINLQQKPEAQLNGFVVAADGSIYFPMVGKIAVGGKTVEEIRTIIVKSLKKYIHNPQVSIRIAVYRSKKIYVMGEVVTPGLQPITDAPLSLADVINLAGGLDPITADARQVFIIRGDAIKPDVYWLNAKSPTAMLLAEQFQMQPKDVVYVSASDTTRWNRGINQILPTVQTLWYTRSLTR